MTYKPMKRRTSDDPPPLSEPEQLPADLIEARHAARIARIHVSGIHRWVLSGCIRGWKRRVRQGKHTRSRLFVSRGEIEQLFERVKVEHPTTQPVGEFSPATRREIKAAERWTERTLREYGYPPRKGAQDKPSE
ncbi:MAG: hypothetical protein L0Y72_18575 [Gemmataceae bacterium]|nr:hypothetical protein [Gemmataceae bacterium]